MEFLSFSFIPAEKHFIFFISIATSFPHGNLIISGSSVHFQINKIAEKNRKKMGDGAHC